MVSMIRMWLFAFGIILITWMCFLLTNNEQMSNTRATERAAGLKSLKVRMLLNNCQEERHRCSAQLNGTCLCPFCPSKTKSFGFLSFGKKIIELHSPKGRTAMEKKHERFEMIEIHSMRVGIEVGGTGWGQISFMENNWNPFSFDFLESGIASGPWHMRQISICQRWQKCGPSARFTIKLTFIWLWSKYFSKYRPKTIAYVTLKKKREREGETDSASVSCLASLLEMQRSGC